MKRLLIAFAFLLIPAALLAQVVDGDRLLTPGGTLYTVESIDNSGAAPADVGRYLQLTIQSGDQKPQSVIVPASLTAGAHWRPALAFDNDSQTLFVFWLKMPNAMSSELLLSSYSNGQWGPVISIDNQSYRLRFNLRVTTTRRVSTLQKDGTYADAPTLLVHVVWWEQTGYGETARYAMIPVAGGTPQTPEIHDLNDFAISFPMFPTQGGPDFNAEILRHPAFVDNGTQDSIDVIFGDTYYDFFNRVTLKPVADGRIHIPIGAHPGGPRIGAPLAFAESWSGPISIITSPHDNGALLLYSTTANAVHYIAFTGGTWSTPKTLQLNDKLTADAAVVALARMVSQ